MFLAPSRIEAPTSSKGNICHKKIEISNLMMKEKPTARLTLQGATESSKLGKTKTKRKNNQPVNQVYAASWEGMGRPSHPTGK